MSVIDIDRHIVTDLAGLQNQVDDLIPKGNSLWKKVISYTVKEDAYYQEKDYKRFNIVRRKKWVAIKRADKIWQRLMYLNAESKGLLMHVITRVDEVDNKRG